MDHSTTRNAASQAVIELRRLLGGKSQAQFAVETMKQAVTTVARWETSHPPRGETLLRLGQIAEQHGFKALGDVFRQIYIEEVFKNLGFNMIRIPATETTPACAYLLLKAEGDKQIEIMRKCWREVLGESDDSPMGKIQKALTGRKR